MPNTGTWSGVFDWPIIGIHAVLTPDNKVLTYGTDQYGQQGAVLIYDVWDPVTNTHYTLPNKTPTDMFCSAAALVPETGMILILGGDGRTHGAPNTGVHDVNVYNPVDMTISPLMGEMSMDGMDHDFYGNMQFERWYPTAVTLANGKIVTLGGIDGMKMGVTTPELYDPHAGWKTLPGADASFLKGDALYPRAWLAGNGKIVLFQASSNPGYPAKVATMDPSGNGSLSVVTTLPFITHWMNPSVMFEENKALILADNGDTWVMDMSGKVPTFTLAGSLGETRYWSNMVVLADGSVMVSGGSGVDNQLADIHNDVQIWNPKTGQWTEGADAAVARLYHSTTLLLPDATVLSLGGGAPGPLTNLNGEIYKPAYLFNADGTLADRPVITDAPEEIAARHDFTISVDNAADIDRLTLVRYGAVTHSLNMGTSKIELTFTEGPGNTLTVHVPNNTNIMTPGEWMLFAFNKNGTPSIASQVHVDLGGEQYSALLGGYLTLNGNAGCNPEGTVFTLTAAAANQNGATMTNARIDLSKDFNLSFNYSVPKGNHEGIAFVLHDDPFGGDAVGQNGAGLGAVGIKNGLAIEFDAKNSGTAWKDIAAPHTDFVDTDAATPALSVISKPVVIGGSPDGKWQYVHISWDAETAKLSYWVNGVLMGTLAGDLAMDYIGGSHAYFGFTGTTSGTSAANAWQNVQIVGLDAVLENGAVITAAPPGQNGIPLTYGTGSGDLLVGSAKNDALFGYGGDDSLYGGGGNDWFEGGKGNDILDGYVGNDTFVFREVEGYDQVSGGAGSDTLHLSAVTPPLDISFANGTVLNGPIGSISFTSIEKVISGSGWDTIVGSANAERIEGGGGNDKLDGAGGDDVLSGGWGKDVLTGGTGRDIFLFDTMPNAVNNLDTITDFNVNDDTIWLENAAFTKLLKTGVLSASQFVVGTKAIDSNDRIIYNKDLGALYYDPDGSGSAAAIKFADITPKLALTNQDFYIV